MERLTIKNSDGSYSQPTHTTFEKMFYKLAEFEDFLEEQGIESLRDLKRIVEAYKLVKETVSSREIPLSKTLQIVRKLLEVLAYKYRWQKLKEWVEEIEKVDFIMTITPQAIFAHMEKLEEEI